jgi:malic enzyme
MFLAAGDAMAAMVTPERLEEGSLFPHQSELRRVSRAVALAVARCARDCGVGRHLTDEEYVDAVDAMIWEPAYVEYDPVEPA